MSAPNKIQLNDVVANRDESVVFQMNLSVNVHWPDIFSKQGDGENVTFQFHNESDVLNLNCLGGLHTTGTDKKERFFPTSFFVRPCLQTALKYRLANDNIRTVVYGSPGIGKSVFAFLAAIAAAATGVHDAVLYLRKVTDQEEDFTSAFWITKADDNTVNIVACREIDKMWPLVEVSRAFSHTHFKGTENAINKTNTPTSKGLKIIVDGPRYEDDTGQAGSDLITSGGCPTQNQDNMDGEWQFPLHAWSFQEMAPALKAIKSCNQVVAKRVFETTGGSIRQALKCLEDNGKVGAGLEEVRQWMKRIADAHASENTIEMLHNSTRLSAHRDSLDRLRSMIVKEHESNAHRPVRQLFVTRLLLASPYVAGLLQKQLTMQDMLEALNFARNSGIGSLYGWHFELWAHRISEIAIDRWQHLNDEAIEMADKAPGDTSPKHVEGEGTGKQSVKWLNATVLYWKPSTSNFANIDAATLLEDGTLTCLQFTVDTVHGFNFRTFKSEFLDELPTDIWKLVKKIVVKFVIPSEKEVFSSVRVPHAQATICTNVVVVEEDSPDVHYVRKKEVPTSLIVPMDVEDSQVTEEEEKGATDDSSMNTRSTFSNVTDYDEELDYEFFYDEASESLETSDWNMKGVNIVFQWMTVDPGDTQPGDSPFFALPQISGADWRDSQFVGSASS